MIGYGKVAPRYPVVFPRTLAARGFHTASFGKDHFGWNDTVDKYVSTGWGEVACVCVCVCFSVCVCGSVCVWW